MQNAALILAAGMSSRMGDFKPMMSIGSISVAQRVVATFHRAGVDKIVMVTGYNAPMLEKHLSDNGIIFLRNEDYRQTQMFDSVKIGLRYLQDKCDRVLLTPVDVPLFTAQTVEKLLSSGSALACPRCQGATGHPILIGSPLIPTILADYGDRGLQGAMERCGEALCLVDVDDPGTLKDADTPEDFSALLAYHNSQLVRPVVNVSLNREFSFFDRRLAMLLMLVDETHSVRAAGQRMQLSYTSCWNMIKALESQLNYPLLQRAQGGAKGSQSWLTQEGKRFLERYNAYEQAVKTYADSIFEDYFEGLFE